MVLVVIISVELSAAITQFVVELVELAVVPQFIELAAVAIN